MTTSFIFLTFILISIRVNNGVHCYMTALSSTSRSSSRWTARPNARPSMFQLRRAVRSWDYQSSISLSSSFYDDFEDFEDFGELGSSGSGGSNDNNANDEDKKEQDGDNSNNKSSNSNAESISSDSSSISASGDDAVMNSLRNRMADLSKQRDEEDDFDDEEEEEDEEEDDEDDDYMDSGSALPDLEGNTLSSIDDLIGFAQAKAREKAKDSKTGGDKSSSILGGTWEDENWARSVSRVDESTGEILDFSDILEGGVVLIANPAKFCSDLTDDSDNNDKGKKGGKILGGLFDDPFPQSTGSGGGKSSTNNISPALLAKFGITLPPSPDLGPDRRADLLPVVLLIDRDQVKGCQAVLMNRRTGNLMGDLPPSLFESAEGSSGEDTDIDESGYTPHPLSAFMIQPLWWAGSSPGGNGMGDEEGANRGGGVKAIDMIHACPYVNGSVPLDKSDGLYWGGNPVQAQEAMKDGRLEKPLSGFDFKFFIQTTRWLPSQVCFFL